MKKLVLAFGACALTSLSFASVNVNLDQEYWTVNPGGSVTITGTVTLTPGWDVTNWTVEFPSNGSVFLPTFIDVDFDNYSFGVTNANYSGPLFTVSPDAAAALGLYDQSTAFSGSLSTRAEFGVTATRLSDGATADDYENYGVEVQAVPEPASLAALGLGAAAFLRRRKRA
ncbi:PEP-CTERM sorting domain-containing protein [bacterium]|nr:MAG: PEP-CTERM sorting domain-containing protein [bacterium]